MHMQGRTRNENGRSENFKAPVRDMLAFDFSYPQLFPLSLSLSLSLTTFLCFLCFTSSPPTFKPESGGEKKPSPLFELLPFRNLCLVLVEHRVFCIRSHSFLYFIAMKSPP